MHKHVLYFSLVAMGVFNSTIGHAFSNHDVKGGYAFQLIGPTDAFSFNESPNVTIGQIIADGSGHLKGHSTFRSAGATCLGTIVGTYAIHVDGTGVLSGMMDTSSPNCSPQSIDLVGVLSDKGVQLDVISQKDSRVVGQFIRQEKTNFTLSDMNGSYAMHISGKASLGYSEQTDLIGVGVLTLDGKGKLAGIGTLQYRGVTCHGRFKGAYALDIEGTGTLTTQFVTRDSSCAIPALDFNTVVFKKGKGLTIISQDHDNLVGSLNRQSAK